MCDWRNRSCGTLLRNRQGRIVGLWDRQKWNKHSQQHRQMHGDRNVWQRHFLEKHLLVEIKSGRKQKMPSSAGLFIIQLYFILVESEMLLKCFKQLNTISAKLY